MCLILDKLLFRDVSDTEYQTIMLKLKHYIVVAASPDKI